MRNQHQIVDPSFGWQINIYNGSCMYVLYMGDHEDVVGNVVKKMIVPGGRQESFVFQGVTMDGCDDRVYDCLTLVGKVNRGHRKGTTWVLSDTSLRGNDWDEVQRFPDVAMHVDVRWVVDGAGHGEPLLRLEGTMLAPEGISDPYVQGGLTLRFGSVLFRLFVPCQ